MTVNTVLIEATPVAGADHAGRGFDDGAGAQVEMFLDESGQGIVAEFAGATHQDRRVWPRHGVAAAPALSAACTATALAT